MSSRSSDIDDRKTHRKKLKVDRKSKTIRRSSEKFLNIDESISHHKHKLHRHHHKDYDEKDVIERHRKNHFKSENKSKYRDSDRTPDFGRSHHRRIRSEHDYYMKKHSSSQENKNQASSSASNSQHDNNHHSQNSTSSQQHRQTNKTSDEECLIGEILHNITNVQKIDKQQDELESNSSQQQEQPPLPPFGPPPPPPPLPEEEMTVDDPVNLETITVPTDPVQINSPTEEDFERKLAFQIENHEPVKFVIKSQRINVLDLPMPPAIDCIHSKSHHRSEKRSKTKSKRSSNSSHYRRHHEQKIDIPLPQQFPELKKKKPRPTIIDLQNQIHNNFEVRSLDSFKICHLVGEGTYGKVYKAVDLISKITVGLKYVRMEREHEGIPITTVREIKLLRSLNHPNIVTLNAIVYSDHKKYFSTFLSFEYMNHDLLAILRHDDFIFTEEFIFMIFKQILQGVNYCHSRNIIHRDLKCSNIVLNSRGEVKVADWGLAREWVEGRPFTNKVSSLWYRAIELLLGDNYYTTAVDMWSLGCIFGELFKRSAIFQQCNEEVEIINAIFKLCGHPNSVSWPKANLLPHFAKFVNQKTKLNIRSVRDNFIGQIPPLALDLLDKMLHLNPERRLTASEALESNWITIMSLRKIRMPLELLESDDFHELLRKTKTGNE